MVFAERFPSELMARVPADVPTLDTPSNAPSPERVIEVVPSEDPARRLRSR